MTRLLGLRRVVIVTAPRPLPTVGDRVHMDCRPQGFCWSAEVRAVVDDFYLVLREWKGVRWRYWLESRYSWESGHIKPGPLPRH